MRKHLIKTICLIMLISTASSLAAQKSYEFINQSIEEIVYALSLNEHITIVCDDTVTGNASFRYSGLDFSQAFDSFLCSARLYVTKGDALWTVSRTRIFFDDENNVQLDCYDVKPSVLFEKLSEKSGVTIVYDVIPATPVSLHISNISLLDTCELIVSGSERYEITNNDTYISVTKTSDSAVESLCDTGICTFEKDSNNNDLYKATILNTKAFKAIDLLCGAAGKEVIQFYKPDFFIEKIVLNEKSFEQLLTLICLKSKASYIEDKGLYCIVPSQDASSDIKNAGKTWHNYTLKFRKAQTLIPLLISRFPSISVLELQSYSIIVLCTDILKDEISAFLETLDCSQMMHLITLQYIKVADFLNNLPPSVSAENFNQTGDDTKLFFTGTQEAYKTLCSQIEFIDVPVKRITYDLLIIQYQQSKTSSWSPSLIVRPVELGDALLASAEVGSVMDLQFNVITSFGLTFAANLHAALNENKANIFADTTLHGISGSTITFQNTSTYRYRDTALDPDTGKPVYTGVTREIVSGLMLDIEGWVSGDGMVTTKVSASVSKRGADVSNSIGNPPPTYEKIITTQVRSRSGEPVVLSGLVQDDSVLVQERMPLLSKIPLLGYLFTSQSKTDEKTEMVIYLIPHLDEETVGTREITMALEGEKESVKRNEKIYRTYISGEVVDE